jgi:hypothetical protein
MEDSVSSLISAFEQELATARRKYDELALKIEKCNEACRAQEKLRGALIKKQGEIKFVNWIADVAYPLADTLAERAGKQARVLGPRGIGAKLHILLVDGAGNFDWQKDEYMELVVEPDFQDGHLTILYETGEVTDRYKSGTLGQASGLNNVTAPLPDSIDEILALFKPRSPIKKG